MFVVVGSLYNLLLYSYSYSNLGLKLIKFFGEF